jgi:pentose-5-phosphate-3-epimerase
MELYWLNKSLFIQVVEETGQQCHTTLSKLNLMDKKYEVSFKVVYDIDIIVPYLKDGKQGLVKAVEPDKDGKF